MPADFLQLAGKRILVMGVANRKSVAWHISRVLVEAGAEVVYAVRNEARREQVQQLVGDAPCSFAMSSSRTRSTGWRAIWPRSTTSSTASSTRSPSPIMKTA